MRLLSLAMAITASLMGETATAGPVSICDLHAGMVAVGAPTEFMVTLKSGSKDELADVLCPGVHLQFRMSEDLAASPIGRALSKSLEATGQPERIRDVSILGEGVLVPDVGDAPTILEARTVKKVTERTFGTPMQVAPARAAVPSKLRFQSSQADYGLVVLEAEAPLEVMNYNLGIVRLEGSKLKYSPRKGWLNLIKLGQGQRGRKYYLAKADPAGLYVFQEASVLLWSACFNGGTKAFEVKPGEIVFVGRFDPNPAMRQIRAELPASTTYSKPQTVFDTPRPSLTPPTGLPGWKDEVQSFLAREYPHVKGEPVAAELKDVTFDKGRTLNGTSCDRY